MSDPISITGLVISALGVAQWIFDYTSSCIDAPDHIRDLSVQVKLTGEALDMLRKHLKSPKSQAISLERTSVLFAVAGGCYDLLGRLQKLLPSSRPTKKGHKIMQRLLWHLEKGDAENAILSLRIYVQIFHLALDLDGLMSLSSKYEESSQFIIQKLEALTVQGAASGEEEIVPVRQVLEDLKLVFEKAVDNLEQRLLIAESEAKKVKLLSALDGLPFQERHIDLQMRRMEGLGEWLLLSPEFVGWREGSVKDRILWCHGAPGVGKTYLTSVIIDHLQDRVVHTKGQVLYFYFDYGRQIDQTALKILISLLKQLVITSNGFPETASKLVEHIESGRGLPSWRFLVDNFIKICSTSSEVFLVLDALDECDEHKNRLDILDLLERLGTESKIRILITSRPYPSDIKLAYAEYPEIVIEASDADIRMFLAHIISKCRRQWPREILAGELGTRVIDEITSKSRGMFLLPALQIDYILNQTNEVEVKKALGTLPSGLQQTLDLTLARIKNQDSQGTSRADLAMRVLMWISHAKRPLKIDELQIAVHSAFQTSLSNLDTACDLIMECCLGLVITDAKIRTIRLVHQSIDEYLQARSALLFPRAHQKLAFRCTEYIGQFYHSRPKLPTGINHITKDVAYEIHFSAPLLEYAINFWGVHASKGLDNQLECELIQFCDNSAVLNFWANLFVFSDSISVATLYSHHTEGYMLYRGTTKMFVYKSGPISILHVATIFGIEGLVRYILNRDKTALNSRDPFGRTALILSAAYGRSQILDILVQQTDLELNVEDDTGNTALSLAAMLKNEPIVTRLLSLPNIDVNIGQPLPRAAGYVYSPQHTLKPAPIQSADAVVKLLLLRPDLDVNQEGPDSYAPWEHLALDFNPSALKSLLSRDDFQRLDESYQTIIDLCKYFTTTEFRWTSHVLAAVRVLLELDQDNRFNLDEWKDCGFLNAIAAVVRFAFTDDPLHNEEPDRSYKYTLDPGPTIVDSSRGNMRASIRSAMETFGLSMSSRDSKGRSFIHASASQGNEESLNLCLQYGLDIGAKDSEGLTALHYAVKNGEMDMTARLLKMGLDPNAADHQGRTTAHFAAQLSQRNMLQLLQAARANLSVQDVIGDTPLHVAAGKCDTGDMIEYMVQELGDLKNAVAFDGDTPLHAAVRSKNIKNIEALLRLGADPNMSSRAGGTPLDRAAQDGDSQLARVLVFAGADTGHRDIFGKTCCDWLKDSVPSSDAMGSIIHTRITPPTPQESRDIILQYMTERVRLMLKYKHQEEQYSLRLSRQLMFLGDDSNAAIAASAGITSKKRNQTLTWARTCDNCVSLVGFRYVCRSCAAVQLCKRCLHADKKEWLSACRNHEFLKVPGDDWAGLRDGVVDAEGRTFEEWLRHIQTKYNLRA